MSAPQRKVSTVNFSDQTRFVVLLLSTLCLSIIVCNCLALNFTIICMMPSREIAGGNSTTANGQQYDYTNTERGLLFSAVAIGAIAATQPVVWMNNRFGGRITFTAFGLLSAIATLLSPLAASVSFYALFAMRILQGFAVSYTYPSLGSITAEWTALQQSGMYISLMSCYLQIGPIFTMPVAGALCVSEFGWPAVYYLQGTLTVILFIVFYAFFRDSPRVHRHVSDKELARIEDGKNYGVSHGQKVPYSLIFKDIKVWGMWLATLGGATGFNTFVQFGPIYLNKVLNYDIENTGLASALPFVASMIFKICAGPLSDHSRCLSQKSRILLFTAVSQGVMAACILVLAILPPSMTVIGQIFYTAAIGFSGLTVVGVVKAAQLISCQHVHFVMAGMSMIGWFVVLVLPGLVGLLAPDNSPGQWSLIFCVISGIVIVTNVFFMFVADSEPAQWTRTDLSGKSGKVGDIVAGHWETKEEQTTER